MTSNESDESDEKFLWIVLTLVLLVGMLVVLGSDPEEDTVDFLLLPYDEGHQVP